MSELSFDKYAVKGAYHWAECFGPLHRMNAYTLGRYEIVLSALASAQLSPTFRVLDVGCGDGALSGLIAMQTKAQIDGVDVEPLSIELARKEFSRRGLTGRFARIDGYAYPFDDGTFEAVICSDAIEHVQRPEDMLREMWRVLAPAGVLVLTTPIRYTEAPRDRMHVQEWFPGQFEQFCSDTLGVAVELRLSHPVALAEVFALPSPITGRIGRLIINAMTKIGHNPFTRASQFRAFSTQTVLAKKPS